MKITIEKMDDVMFGIEIFPDWMMIHLPFVSISILSNKVYDLIFV